MWSWILQGDSFFSHLRCLPVRKRNEAADELLSIGETQPDTPSSQGAYLLQARLRSSSSSAWASACAVSSSLVRARRFQLELVIFIHAEETVAVLPFA